MERIIENVTVVSYDGANTTSSITNIFEHEEKYYVERLNFPAVTNVKGIRFYFDNVEYFEVKKIQDNYVIVK